MGNIYFQLLGAAELILGLGVGWEINNEIFKSDVLQELSAIFSDLISGYSLNWELRYHGQNVCCTEQLNFSIFLLYQSVFS